MWKISLAHTHTLVRMSINAAAVAAAHWAPSLSAVVRTKNIKKISLWMQQNGIDSTERERETKEKNSIQLFEIYNYVAYVGSERSVEGFSNMRVIFIRSSIVRIRMLLRTRDYGTERHCEAAKCKWTVLLMLVEAFKKTWLQKKLLPAIQWRIKWKVQNAFSWVT